MRGRQPRLARMLLPLLAALLVTFPGQTAVNEAALSYFTDVELVDQRGQTLRFYTDLLQGKVVVISAFFTTCAGVCPVMSKKLASLQSQLGDRMGDDVVLLSISVDPTRDTPSRLLDYAERWKAGDGWYFLSGTPDNVKLALSRLGQYVEDPEAHSPILLIGNEPTGLWKKANGLASAEELIAIVDSVIRDEQ